MEDQSILITKLNVNLEEQSQIINGLNLKSHIGFRYNLSEDILKFRDMAEFMPMRETVAARRTP